MREYKAPEAYTITPKDTFVFLAGSIEMGKAIDWQEEIIKEFRNTTVSFLNPRRTNWDNNWEQSIKDKNFREQVQWELQGLEDSDIIVLFLDPNTKSPISLLELGLFANSDKLIVCCPDGFYRKGNVEVVCDKFKIPLVATFEMLIEILKLKV